MGCPVNFTEAFTRPVLEWSRPQGRGFITSRLCAVTGSTLAVALTLVSGPADVVSAPLRYAAWLCTSGNGKVGVIQGIMKDIGSMVGSTVRIVALPIHTIRFLINPEKVSELLPVKKFRSTYTPDPPKPWFSPAAVAEWKRKQTLRSEAVAAYNARERASNTPLPRVSHRHVTFSLELGDGNTVIVRPTETIISRKASYVGERPTSVLMASTSSSLI